MSAYSMIHPLQRREWGQILLRRHRPRHMHTVCVCVCVCVCSIWKLLYFYWTWCVARLCRLKALLGLLVSVRSAKRCPFHKHRHRNRYVLSRPPLASLALTSVQLQRREVTKCKHSATVLELIFQAPCCPHPPYISEQARYFSFNARIACKLWIVFILRHFMLRSQQHKTDFSLSVHVTDGRGSEWSDVEDVTGRKQAERETQAGRKSRLSDSRQRDVDEIEPGSPADDARADSEK